MVDDIKPGHDKLLLIDSIIDIIDGISNKLYVNKKNVKGVGLLTGKKKATDEKIDMLYTTIKAIKIDYGFTMATQQKERKEEKFKEHHDAKSIKINCMEEFYRKRSKVVNELNLTIIDDLNITKMII